MKLFLYMSSGMANSVDPDQTVPSGAVWSGSALFAYAILSDILVYKILGYLPYVAEQGFKLMALGLLSEVLLTALWSPARIQIRKGSDF